VAVLPAVDAAGAVVVVAAPDEVVVAALWVAEVEASVCAVAALAEAAFALAGAEAAVGVVAL